MLSPIFENVRMLQCLLLLIEFHSCITTNENRSLWNLFLIGCSPRLRWKRNLIILSQWRTLNNRYAMVRERRGIKQLFNYCGLWFLSSKFPCALENFYINFNCFSTVGSCSTDPARFFWRGAWISQPTIGSFGRIASLQIALGCTNARGTSSNKKACSERCDQVIS